MGGRLQEGWNSQTARVLAIIVLGLCLLIAIAVSVMNIVSPAESTPAPVSASSDPVPESAASEPNGDATPAGCSVSPGDTSLAPQPPTDLRWEAAEGYTWPTSASLGPTRMVDGRPVCFARSPQGAGLFMASVLATIARSESTDADYLFYVEDGTGKQALAESLKGFTGADTDLNAGRGTIAGFRTVSFTSDQAQIGIVLTTSASVTGYVEAYVTLDWVDDDWRIRVNSDGTFAPVPVSTVAADAFVDWRKE